MNRDREIADKLVRSWIGGPVILPSERQFRDSIEAALTAASAAHQGAIRRLLPTAMLDAWNDIVSDTGAFPEDLERRRGKLYFTPYRWADTTASFLVAALSRLTVQEAGEGK